MKKILFSFAILLAFLTSCSPSFVVTNYPKDDVYYSSKDYTPTEIQVQKEDTPVTYEEDNYYDYTYSSRIRRFHNNYFYSSYYSDYYTDLYWYNYDPYYYGTSIYATYNWLWPTYGYFYNSYIPPYYYWHNNPYYWNPYLGNVYWNNWGYGHNYWGYNNNWNYNWYSNNLNNVYYGPRGNHMTSTHNGMTIRPSRTSQGGKIGGKIGRTSDIKQEPKKNIEVKKDIAPQKYQNPPRTYSSPQFTKPRSSQEYVAPSYDNPKRYTPKQDVRPTSPPKQQPQKSEPRYNPQPQQQRSTPPRVSPSPPRNNGSSSSPSQGKRR